MGVGESVVNTERGRASGRLGDLDPGRDHYVTSVP